MNPASPLLLALAFLTLVGSAQDRTVPVPELETLKQEYASLVKTADGPHLAAIAELDKKYIAKLEQEQQTAQQAGKLDEAMAMDKEKTAISSGSGVLVEDDDKTSGVLRKMHVIYRAEIAKLEVARARNHKPLRDDYASELDSLVMRLTKDGKLKEAMAGELCVLWDWRDGSGRPKDLAARSFLLTLEQRGWIALPPLREACRKPRAGSGVAGDLCGTRALCGHLLQGGQLGACGRHARTGTPGPRAQCFRAREGRLAFPSQIMSATLLKCVTERTHA